MVSLYKYAEFSLPKILKIRYTQFLLKIFIKVMLNFSEMKIML
jgi:hypothetical protein